MKIILNIIFCLFVVFAVQPIYDEWDPKKSQLNPTILSQSEANKLFSEFQSMDHIPYDYPIDGCYARATAMARAAEKKKINMAKIYAEGYLRVRTEDKRFDPVEWGWHVAPVAYVKIQQQDNSLDGNKDSQEIEITVLMVFDPSLFDKPVPVDVWLKRMETQMEGRSPSKVEKAYYSTKFQYYSKRGGESKKYGWMKDDLDNSVETMKNYIAISRNKVTPEQLTNIQKAFK